MGIDLNTMSRNRICLIATFVAALALIAGCAEFLDDVRGHDDVCDPGRTVECACAGDLDGFQTCEDDQEGYGECVCGDQLGTDTTESGDDFGGDGQATGTPETTPTQPEPDPIPDVTAVLNSAQMRVFVVNSTTAVEVNADWSATGASDLRVDLEVLSSTTYRQWTPILRNQPPEYFATASLPGFAPGERRFDYRIVAYDTNGNRFVSNVITVQ